MHAAHQVRNRFPDGQLYVNLGGGSGESPPDAHDVLGRFLRDLGVAATWIPAEPQERQALYRSMLAGRAALLVLDDARDAAQVVPLLPGSGPGAAIVTSRNQLATVPSTWRLCLTVLDDPAARALFTRIVGAPRVRAEPAAVAAVLAACRGLPLALRIAGARVVSRPDWTIRTLADHLAQAQARLDVLQLDDLGVRASFQVSYGQLDPAHARVFRLVGLCPGPDIGTAAIAALLDRPAARIDESLDVLMASHLLDAYTPGRYRLHDLLRVYARERARAEEPATARQAALNRLFDHYRYTASVAMDVIAPQERQHRPTIVAPDHTTVTFLDQATALAWLDTERVNLMTAATADDAYTLDLSVILWRYLKRRIHNQDALRLHTDALRIARRRQDLLGEARELRHIALIHFQLGQYPDAVGYLLRSLALSRHTGAHAVEAYTLSNLGLVSHRMGHLDTALAHHRQALALGRAADDRAAEMVALDNLGMLHTELGDTARALDSYHQALALHRATGDRSGEAVVLNCLGALHRELGDPAGATDLYHRALDLHRALADPLGQAEVLSELGQTALSDGRPVDAVDHLTPALSLVAVTGERRYLANIHYQLARAHHQLGAHHSAHAHCRQALDLHQALGGPDVEAARALLVTIELERPSVADPRRGAVERR